MKLEYIKTPTTNPDFARGYWENLKAFTGAGENITLELSPLQSWSFLRTHLVSFHCHPDGFLELEFPVHTAVVWPKDAGKLQDLARRIVAGDVSVLRARFCCAGIVLRNEAYRHAGLKLEAQETGFPQVLRVRFLQIYHKTDD